MPIKQIKEKISHSESENEIPKDERKRPEIRIALGTLLLLFLMLYFGYKASLSYSKFQ